MLSNKLKQRFCKDNKLSIQLFNEPFFSDRLELLGYKKEYEEFEKLIADRFNNSEQEYLEHYNKLKDTIIDYIKSSKAFQLLNSDDMNKYKCSYNFKQSDVYKETNVGKRFISIDMKKANFSSLIHYGNMNEAEFFDAYNWEEFMRQFTDIDYFTKSKYIRQVVFGNCNPKRQVTYEKFLMSVVLDRLISNQMISEKDVYSMCSDEIIISTEKLTAIQMFDIEAFIRANNISEDLVPLHFEIFKVLKIQGTEAYIKQFEDNKLSIDTIKLKCVNPYELPVIYRYLKGETVKDSDLYFEFNGRVVKFIDIPEISIIGE